MPKKKERLDASDLSISQSSDTSNLNVLDVPGISVSPWLDDPAAQISQIHPIRVIKRN